MSVEVTTYEGNRLCYADFSHKSEEEALGIFDTVKSLYENEEQPLPMLVNFNGANITPGVLKRGKEIGALVKTKLQRQAFLGIDPVKAMLVKSYAAFTGMKVQFFSDETAAKDWLIGK